MKQKQLRGFDRFWQLAKPYWVSKEKGKGWLLLVTIISMALGQVYISVLLNKWNAAFYDALQNKNFHEFLRQIGIFSLLAAAFIAIAVYRLYFSQMLQILWRTWMTNAFQKAWLSEQAYYRLQVIYKSTDNPDQRIADDIDGFTNSTLSLGIGLLSSVVTLVSFVAILWNLSGALNFTVAGHPVSIPGYMVWAALVYSIVGTWLTHKIGRRLVGLNYDQQRFEANFRFSMIRLRENAESIAFYKGGDVEQENLRERFSHIVRNWWQIMKKQKQLTWFTSGYGQIATIFPFLVAAPRYFSGAIKLGGLMQTAMAFGQVQDSLSWLVNVYPQYAGWQATTDRLSGFASAITKSNDDNAQKKIAVNTGSQEHLTVDELSLLLPDGTALVRKMTMNIVPGDRLLLMGATGSGKTTFLRALADMWPFGNGDVRLPAGSKVLFVPQKPYLPILPLKNVLCYPHSPDAYDAAELAEGLKAVGLEKLVPRLDETDNWAQILSVGEQQKLAFARIVLQKPDVLLLDEATASLDGESEDRLYKMITDMLPRAIIVSVGHRESLAKWHGETLRFSQDMASIEAPVS